MPSHLRKLRGGKVSFFLFMDTITAVTAMLIMVSLMMTLYFGDSPLAGSAAADPIRVNQSMAELDRVNAQNQALRLQLASVQAAPSLERLAADIAELQWQLGSQASNLALLKLQLTEAETEAQRKADELGVGEEHRQLEATELLTRAMRLTNDLAQAELDELLKKTKETEAQLEKTKRESSKLWLIPETDSSGKQPLLVSVSASNLVCERFNQPQSRKEFSAGAADREFTKLLSDLRPDRDYFVFYVRPSGIRQFQQFSSLAKHAGFNVGYDAVEEDRQIFFRQPRPEL